jgi:hypothetical protein
MSSTRKEQLMAITREPADRPPATRRERRIDRATWIPTVGPGMVLGVVGTIGVVVSMFMSWQNNGVHPSGIPFAFLFDSTTTARDPSLLIALIPLAIVLAVGSLMPRASGARLVGALGVLAVLVLFAVQLHYAVDRFGGGSVWDLLDTGFYVAAIAALVGLVGGFMPSGWTRRRWTESETAIDPEPVHNDPHTG